MRASAHQVEEKPASSTLSHTPHNWVVCKCQQRRNPQNKQNLEESVNRPEHRDVVAITPGTTCRRVRSARGTANHLPLFRYVCAQPGVYCVAARTPMA